MSKITKWLALVCLGLTSLMSSRGLAQSPQDGFVTGTGTVEIKRLPELLRVQVDVMAKGKDLKEALAKLKERQEAAKLRLAALGAGKDAIEVGEPGVTSEKSSRQLQMERMVGERSGGGRKPSKDKEAPPVVVGLTIKAELPIKASSVEDLLMQFQTLKEKVIAADLGGLKEMQKLSPKEEELAEESEKSDRYREEDEPRKGEPILVFVCKISEEDRAKARADAFTKAKRE